MHYTITQEQFSQDQRIQECGMQWAAAIKKWEREMRLKDAILEPKTAKTDKESPSIKWENFTIQWALSTNKKLFMLSN